MYLSSPGFSHITSPKFGISSSANSAMMQEILELFMVNAVFPQTIIIYKVIA